MIFGAVAVSGGPFWHGLVVVGSLLFLCLHPGIVHKVKPSYYIYITADSLEIAKKITREEFIHYIYV